MLAVLPVGDNPGDGWESSVLRGSIELRELLDVAKFAVLLDRVKIGQRVADIGRACMLGLGLAGHSVILAVRLCPIGYIVGPGYVGFVEQVGEIGPGIIGPFLGGRSMRSPASNDDVIRIL